MKYINFQPRDLVAILTIIVLAIFKLTGHNGTFDAAVAIIMGYYFARREDHPVMVKKEELPLK